MKNRYTESEIKTAIDEIVEALEKDNFILELIARLRENKKKPR